MPTNHAMLHPVVGLAVWTFVMWVWMYATRIPAMRRAKVVLDPNAIRGSQMSTLPASVRWKADNYNHLHEQPTVFYAIAITLALLGDAGLGVWLAWAYVGLRVVHSLLQATWNNIMARFSIFAVSSLVLAAMTFRAVALCF